MDDEKEVEVKETSENSDVQVEDVKEPTYEDYQALAKKNKQLFARAKKAEDEAKAIKAADEAAKAAEEAAKAAEAEKLNNKPEQSTDDAIDLRFLQRDGATEEDIAKLRQIQAGAKAMGKTISLVEAQQDELYQAYQERKKAQDRSDKAQLNPNGSAHSEAQAKVSKMTDEEHAEFARQKAEEAKRNMGLA